MKSSDKGNCHGFLRKTEGIPHQGGVSHRLTSLWLNRQDISINHLQTVLANIAYILKAEL